MTYPDRSHENLLAQLGCKYIAGVDEVGRGALAGPIVAAAVILPLDCTIKKVRDSKLLSEKLRNQLYQEIIDNALAWNVSLIDEKVIDEKGITFANELAFKESIKGLAIKPDHVLIDGSKLKIPEKSTSIVKGDQKVYSIAAASIIAKVTRDRLMIEYSDKYPDYNFASHKGYGTKIHCDAIKKVGASEIHRKSFLNKILEK